MGLKKYGVLLLKLTIGLVLLFLLQSAVIFVLARFTSIPISENVATWILVTPILIYFAIVVILAFHWYFRSYLPWIKGRIKEKEEGRR